MDQLQLQGAADFQRSLLHPGQPHLCDSLRRAVVDHPVHCPSCHWARYVRAPLAHVCIHLHSCFTCANAVLHLTLGAASMQSTNSSFLCAGSSRSVNRRYIADFVSKAERTKASAAFVGSSAVGMALGPMLSQLLSRFPYITWHGISLNPITMGAWVMSLFWLIFLYFNVVHFDDPRKT